MVETKSKTLINTPVFRGCFPAIWNPQYPKDSNGQIIADSSPYFSIEAIFPWAELTKEEREKRYAGLKELVKQAKLKKWGAKEPMITMEDGSQQSAVKSPFRIASPGEFPTSYDNRPEIHGKLVISLKSSGSKDRPAKQPQVTLFTGKNPDGSFKKPRLLDKDKEEDRNLVYAGAFYMASVTAFAYSNKRTGVSISLRNLMVMRPGDPLGSFSRAEDDFSPDNLGEGIVDDYDYDVDNSAMFDEEAAAADDLLG